MKKLIRKWLEIEDKPNYKAIMNGLWEDNEDKVKSMVEDAICEALSPELPIENSFFWGRHKDIRGTLDKHLKALVGETAHTEVAFEVNKLLNPESFIDDVVKRIKSKQLGSE